MTGETLWEGRFMAVRREGTWEYVERVGASGAVAIVAVHEAEDGGHLLLIEQHRVPAGRACLELPAGLVGDEGEDEAPAIAAARELEEETGYRAATIEALGEFYSSPGLTSDSFTLVRATGLERVGEPEAGIVLHRVPLADVPAFVAERRRAGMGVDVRLLVALGEL